MSLRLRAHTPVKVIAAVIAVFAALFGCAGAGCQRSSGNPAANAPLIIAPYDRSASTNAGRTAQLDALDELANVALARSAQIEVWVFDNEPLEVWGPQVPMSPDELLPIKQKYLPPDNSSARSITRPGKLLAQIVQDPAFVQARQVDLVINSDGDLDDDNDRPEFIRSAKALCHHGGIRVFVIGFDPHNRPLWQSAFGSLGPNLHLVGASEADHVMRELMHG